MPERAFFYIWCDMSNQAAQNGIKRRTTVGIKKSESQETKMVRKQSEHRESQQFSIQGAGIASAVMPTYDPLTLFLLTHNNNTLLQCIEAMEVNIDGTGVEIVNLDPDKDKDELEVARIKEILDEPYPDMTLITMRRKIRRDLESTGMGYLEVIKNAKGEFVGFKPLDAYHCRLTTLSKEVETKKTLTRNGVEMEFTIKEKERGVMYRKNKTDKPVYMKIWGNTQDIDSESGVMGSDIDEEKKGTEVIVFSMNDDPETPYGVPRWINQIPSVVGSRKAEEQNLDYFDAGGIPAAIIFVNGGQVAQDSTNTLRDFVSGKNRNNNKAVVVEVQSTSGTLDSAGSTSVQVERFGSEAVSDAMYRNYDKDCEEHVRLAFRLPPIFVGKAAEYNYATAVVAYQVAEAQVFKPERDEFDAIINKVLKTEMKLTTCKIKSNPISLRDITTQLRAIGLMREVAEPEQLLNEVNKLAEVNLQYKEGKEFTTSASRSSGLSVEENSNPLSVSKGYTVSAEYVLDLAKRFCTAKNLIANDTDYTPEAIEEIEGEVQSLTGSDLSTFNSILSIYMFGSDNLVNGSVLS